MSNPIPKRKFTHADIGMTDLQNPIKTPRKTTPKHSAWWVTVNTNMSFQPNDPNLKPVGDTLMQTLNELLNDDEEFMSVLTINTRVKNREIDHSMSKFKLERGANVGMPHAHGIITIRHRSNLQIGYKKFKEWVFKEFCRKLRRIGIKPPLGMYFNFKLLKEYGDALDDMARLEAYMEKNKSTIDQSTATYFGKPGSHRYTAYTNPEPRVEQPVDEDDVDAELAAYQEAQNGDLLQFHDSESDSDSEEDFAEYEDSDSEPDIPVPVPAKKRQATQPVMRPVYKPSAPVPIPTRQTTDPNKVKYREVALPRLKTFVPQ